MVDGWCAAQEENEMVDHMMAWNGMGVSDTQHTHGTTQHTMRNESDNQPITCVAWDEQTQQWKRHGM